MLPLCACGCGHHVNQPSERHRTRIPRYLKGHARRGLLKHAVAPPDVPTGVCECGCGGPTEICTFTRAERRQYKGFPMPLISGHKRPEPSDGIRGLSATESAYLAGIVDGEGCIHMPKGVRHIRVNVANTSATLIEWLRGLGGTVIVNRRNFPTGTKSTKPVFSWSVNSWHNCRALLTQIEPHMLIKRDRARHAIALLTEWMSGPKKERKKQCVRGHWFTANNTSIDKDKAQRCRECSRERTRQYRARLATRKATEHRD